MYNYRQVYKILNGLFDLSNEMNTTIIYHEMLFVLKSDYSERVVIMFLVVILVRCPPITSMMESSPFDEGHHFVYTEPVEILLFELLILI